MKRSNFLRIGVGISFLFFILSIFIVFLNNKFSLFEKYQASQDLTKMTVRLGWVHQTQFAGLYVAKEKEFYKDAGIDVTFLPLDELKNQEEELAQGKVQASVMEAHQMLGSADKGHPIKAVAAIYQINPHTLAVRAESSIHGPEDFDKKVLGLSGGVGEGDEIFKILVKKFGKGSEPRYIDLGFNAVDDFANNRADIIDLYRTDQPYLAQKRGIPLRFISLEAYGLTTYGDVLAMNKEFIQKNPELTRKFVKATLKGWEYALRNQEEAVEITLPYTNEQYHDKDYLRYILKESAPLIQGAEGTRLGEMELSTWSVLYESMKSVKALQKDLDIHSIFTNEYVQ